MLLVNSVPVMLTKRSFGTEAIDFLEASLHAVAQDRRNTPFTPAVHADCSLAQQARARLATLGIEPVVAPEESSVMLRSYLSKTLFRISTMGDVTPADMNRLLKCCAQRV
jgi:2-aminoethylphosphonate-pyruvate transaminase